MTLRLVWNRPEPANPGPGARDPAIGRPLAAGDNFDTVLGLKIDEDNRRINAWYSAELERCLKSLHPGALYTKRRIDDTPPDAA